ncbi:MarR family transcriptional regulator [Clostridium sp. CX1]|uniref:MarR family winged helix-turn-helix transcriptional regulator n=1 Tax=Clostridium sp. CX1 TaxID=2978346 RepID=UPI0021BF43B3|nr:MarR family transcriptional regulator [Clostridium sp. CX1]MCT8977348.1 MarR family transcriptional regulator [Clostridium sp. CX1]
MIIYGHKINQLARSFTKKLNEKINPLGLHSSQWAIVLYLHERKQCTQIQLSRYLNVEAPTITRTLIRMEKSGLVIREEGVDKREKHIKLTEKASRMFGIWKEVENDIQAESIDGIDTNELEVFNRVLEKMMKNLD